MKVDAKKRNDFYRYPRYCGDAKMSLLNFIEFYKKKVKCLKIHVDNDLSVSGWIKPTRNDTFLLPVSDDQCPYEIGHSHFFHLLEELEDYEYNHVCKNSIVWFTDGTWAERFVHEWDNNIAGWELCSCPEIPKELLKKFN